MSEYIIQGSTLISIADAIRTKTGSNQTFTPAQMVSAIMSISGGGSGVGSLADLYVIQTSEYGVINYFGDNSSIINVNIIPPRSFVSSSCFNYDNTLLSISFPSASYIEENAFYGCESLVSAIFPTCESIGSYAFYDCSSLSDISFPVCISIEDNAFTSCSLLNSASFSVCTSIGNATFYECTSLTSVSFPSCISIGSSAFYNCSALSNINFPVCTSIGSSAFYYCSALSNISFPLVEYIGDNAFGPYEYDASVNFYFLGSRSSVISIDGYWLEAGAGEHGISIEYSLSIYVPESMYNNYLTTEYWSEYSSWIVSVPT